MNTGETMYNFDDYEEQYADENKPQRSVHNNKRANKRCWREIERFKERRQLSRQIACDENVYFDLLESSAY